MDRPPFRRLTLLALAGLPLAGCAAPKGYPSLQPRAIENVSLAEPAQRPTPPAVASPEATARYASTVESATEADAGFRKVLADERAAIERGRGAATGSEAWIAAQEALSRIEAARTPVTTTLADLDAARNSEKTHTDTGEAVAANAAFETVRQIDQAEAAAIAVAQSGTR